MDLEAGMTNSKNDLKDEIIKISTEHWKNSNEPLLLSQLGPDLKANDLDYKEILGGQGLRQFINTEISELAIAQHPHQYAKLGVHPAGESFSYTDAPVENRTEQTEQDKLRKNRRAFYGFIQAISDLPPEELEGVNIPARVIVRLLEGK